MNPEKSIFVATEPGKCFLHLEQPLFEPWPIKPQNFLAAEISQPTQRSAAWNSLAVVESCTFYRNTSFPQRLQLSHKGLQVSIIPTKNTFSSLNLSDLGRCINTIYRAPTLYKECLKG